MEVKMRFIKDRIKGDVTIFEPGDEVTIWTVNTRGRRKRWHDGTVEKVIINYHARYYMVMVRHPVYGVPGVETTTGWFKSTDLTARKA